MFLEGDDKMKTEKWFDVGCELCGYHVSTDFGKGFA